MKESIWTGTLVLTAILLSSWVYWQRSVSPVYEPASEVGTFLFADVFSSNPDSDSNFDSGFKDKSFQNRDLSSEKSEKNGKKEEFEQNKKTEKGESEKNVNETLSKSVLADSKGGGLEKVTEILIVKPVFALLTSSEESASHLQGGQEKINQSEPLNQLNQTTQADQINQEDSSVSMLSDPVSYQCLSRKIVLTAKNGGWVLPQFFGYPANSQKALIDFSMLIRSLRVVDVIDIPDSQKAAETLLFDCGLLDPSVLGSAEEYRAARLIRQNLKDKSLNSEKSLKSNNLKNSEISDSVSDESAVEIPDEQANENQDDFLQEDVLQNEFGTYCCLLGKNRRPIAEIIFGKNAKIDSSDRSVRPVDGALSYSGAGETPLEGKSFEDNQRRYVRIPGEKKIYVVETPKISVSTDVFAWTERDFLKISRWDIETLSFHFYSFDEKTTDFTSLGYLELQQDVSNASDRLWQLKKYLKLKTDGKYQDVLFSEFSPELFKKRVESDLSVKMNNESNLIAENGENQADREFKNDSENQTAGEFNADEKNKKALETLTASDLTEEEQIEVLNQTEINKIAEVLTHLRWETVRAKSPLFRRILSERRSIRELILQNEPVCPYGFYPSSFDLLNPSGIEPILIGTAGQIRLTLKNGVQLTFLVGKTLSKEFSLTPFSADEILLEKNGVSKNNNTENNVVEDSIAENGENKGKRTEKVLSASLSDEDYRVLLVFADLSPELSNPPVLKTLLKETPEMNAEEKEEIRRQNQQILAENEYLKNEHEIRRKEAALAADEISRRLAPWFYFVSERDWRKTRLLPRQLFKESSKTSEN